jgi:hypothetical protein
VCRWPWDYLFSAHFISEGWKRILLIWLNCMNEFNKNPEIRLRHTDCRAVIYFLTVAIKQFTAL